MLAVFQGTLTPTITPKQASQEPTRTSFSRLPLGCNTLYHSRPPIHRLPRLFPRRIIDRIPSPTRSFPDKLFFLPRATPLRPISSRHHTSRTYLLASTSHATEARVAGCAAHERWDFAEQCICAGRPI